jgi:hypothetical protein
VYPPSPRVKGEPGAHKIMLSLSFSDIDGWRCDSHSTKRYASTPLLSLILLPFYSTKQWDNTLSE